MGESQLESLEISGHIDIRQACAGEGGEEGPWQRKQDKKSSKEGRSTGSSAWAGLVRRVGWGLKCERVEGQSSADGREQEVCPGC